MGDAHKAYASLGKKDKQWFSVAVGFMLDHAASEGSSLALICTYIYT